MFIVPAERVVDFDAFREKSLGDMQDLAAVSSVAVFCEMFIRVLLESDVVPLGRVGGGCCEAPAHVLLA